MQATYIYEAFGTVMANSFGKKKVEWRTKTFSEEYEENHMPVEDKEKKQLRQFALDMETARANFLIAKETGQINNEQQGNP